MTKLNNIWIFQTGEPVFDDKNLLRPMRAMNLSNYFVNKKIHVDLFTTTFNHQLKYQRYKKNTVVDINKYLTVHYVYSPGYNKNLSLSRLFDHFILGLNLYIYLLKNFKNQNLPQFSFVGFPPVEFAFFASIFLSFKKIPFCLDIKDYWPDIIFNSFKNKIVRFLSRIILFHLIFMTKFSLKKSYFFTTISDKYLSWLNRKSKTNKKIILVLPLYSDIFTSLSIDDYSFKNKYKFICTSVKKNILFIGSLSYVFNFDTVFKQLSSNKNFRLIFFGDGHQKSHVELLSKKFNVEIFSPGYVSIHEIKYISNFCLCGLAPYKNLNDFKDSIPNKIYDYISLGLPILSSLSGEVEMLITSNDIGRHYSNNSLIDDLKYIQNKNLQNNINSINKRIKSRNNNFDILYKTINNSIQS